MIVSIDIGTSYSSICILEPDGSAKPVDISTGASMYGSKFSLPSAVYVEDDGTVLVGQAAMNSRKRKPQNFRMEFKRDLGQEIPVMLGNRSFRPEELYTEMFRHMKGRAEQSAGEKIEKAYLTYPASFGKSKKEKVISAARAAGLFEVELVDEPTAAAMSYCQAGLIRDGQTLLIYDFGGGTFDVSLIRYENGAYRLLTEPDGLEHCGGIDIDRMIYQDMMAQIGPELLDMVNANRLNRMRLESQLAEMAVKAKHHLSSAKKYEEDIQVGFDLVPYQLTREQLNSKAAQLVGQTIAVCHSILQAGEIAVKDLAAVLLVGGTSRVPLVQDMVRQFAGQVPVLASVDLELAVAQGAGGFFASRPMSDTASGAEKNEKAKDGKTGQKAGQRATEANQAEMKWEDLEQKETFWKTYASERFAGTKAQTQTENKTAGGEPEAVREDTGRDPVAEQYRKNTEALLKGVDLAGGKYALIGVQPDGKPWQNTQLIGLDCLHTTEHVKSMSYHRGSLALLKNDGTVAVNCLNCTDEARMKTETEKWTDIISVASGYGVVAGLRKDGTVAVTYDKKELEYKEANRFRQLGISSWKNVSSFMISRYSSEHIVGLCRDGTVLAAGQDWLYGTVHGEKLKKACEVYSWRDVCAVTCGDYYTLGLKKDGRAMVTGDNEVAWGNSVYRWRNIVSVSGGARHAAGLRKDGTVAAAGWNEYGQCEVSDWSDIVSVVCGFNHTVGLRRDGTVMAVGHNEYGQCEVSDWENIIAVIAGNTYTAGIRKDGYVVRTDYEYAESGDLILLPSQAIPWRLFFPEDGAAAGAVQAPAAEGKKETGNLHGQSKQEDPGESARERYRKHAESLVSMSHLAVKSDGSLKIDKDYLGDSSLPQDKKERWSNAKNIIAVATGFGVYAVLRADGRVEAYGSSRPDMENQADLWRNVTGITSIGKQLIGIHEDGTLSVTVEPEDYDTVVTKYVRHWKNIAFVSAATGEYRFDKILVAGLCRDGTVVAADGTGELDLSGWSQVTQVKVVHDRSLTKYAVVGLRKDGKVLFSGNGYKVDDWEDIVQISGGYNHLVGLKRDGTVVSAGNNEAGQRNVQHWKDMVSVCCGAECTVGLRRNGTAAVTGEEIRELGLENIPAWKDIIAVLNNLNRVCGIRQDGALIYTNFEIKEIKKVVKRHLFQEDETETDYETVPLPEKILPWKLF